MYFIFIYSKWFAYKDGNSNYGIFSFCLFSPHSLARFSCKLQNLIIFHRYSLCVNGVGKLRAKRQLYILKSQAIRIYLLRDIEDPKYESFSKNHIVAVLFKTAPSFRFILHLPTDQSFILFAEKVLQLVLSKLRRK